MTFNVNSSPGWACSSGNWSMGYQTPYESSGFGALSSPDITGIGPMRLQNRTLEQSMLPYSTAYRSFPPMTRPNICRNYSTAEDPQPIMDLSAVARHQKQAPRFFSTPQSSCFRGGDGLDESSVWGQDQKSFDPTGEGLVKNIRMGTYVVPNAGNNQMAQPPTNVGVPPRLTKSLCQPTEQRSPNPNFTRYSRVALPDNSYGGNFSGQSNLYQSGYEAPESFSIEEQNKINCERMAKSLDQPKDRKPPSPNLTRYSRVALPDNSYGGNFSAQSNLCQSGYEAPESLSVEEQNKIICERMSKSLDQPKDRKPLSPNLTRYSRVTPPDTSYGVNYSGQSNLCWPDAEASQQLHTEEPNKRISERKTKSLYQRKEQKPPSPNLTRYSRVAPPNSSYGANFSGQSNLNWSGADYSQWITGAGKNIMTPRSHTSAANEQATLYKNYGTANQTFPVTRVPRASRNYSTLEDKQAILDLKEVAQHRKAAPRFASTPLREDIDYQFPNEMSSVFGQDLSSFESTGSAWEEGVRMASFNVIKQMTPSPRKVKGAPRLTKSLNQGADRQKYVSNRTVSNDSRPRTPKIVTNLSQNVSLGQSAEASRTANATYDYPQKYSPSQGQAMDGTYVACGDKAADGTYVAAAGAAMDGTYVAAPGAAMDGTYVAAAGAAMDGTYVAAAGAAMDGTYVADAGAAMDGTYVADAGAAMDGTYVADAGAAMDGTYVADAGAAMDGTYVADTGAAMDGTYVADAGAAMDGTYVADSSAAMDGTYEATVDPQSVSGGDIVDPSLACTPEAKKCYENCKCVICSDKNKSDDKGLQNFLPILEIRTPQGSRAGGQMIVSINITCNEQSVVVTPDQTFHSVSPQSTPISVTNDPCQTPPELEDSSMSPCGMCPKFRPHQSLLPNIPSRNMSPGSPPTTALNATL